MHSGNSGIQQHSIGELYPCTIAAIGTDPVRWQAQNLLSGWKGDKWTEYEYAESEARTHLRSLTPSSPA